MGRLSVFCVTPCILEKPGLRFEEVYKACLVTQDMQVTVKVSGLSGLTMNFLGILGQLCGVLARPKVCH